jgi:hypothetical protein
MMRKTLILTTLLIMPAFLLTACGRDDADQPAIGANGASADLQVDAADLFERIDADTIYLMANLETIPDDLMRVFWEPMAAMQDFNQYTYDQTAEEMSDRSPLLAALLRELGQIDSMEALEARGLSANGHWAVHGISLYPAVHWQISDSDVFSATLERLALQAETELPRRDVDGEEIFWVNSGDFSLAIHHDDRFLTIALIPDDHGLMRRVANLDQPTASYNPRDLQTFNQSRGFEPFGSGFLDFGALAARILDQGAEPVFPGARGERLRALSEDEACRAEFSALVGQIPRMTSGMTRMDNREVTLHTRVETDRALGTKLAGIANTPVNIETGATEFLSAGLAFNLVAARDFGRDLVAGWVNNPPECEVFSEIRANAADWQLALNRPIPPFITNLHGFRLNLDRIIMRDESGVEDAAGTLAVFMRNPQMLLGMAQMFSPELAALDLRPGGEPQRLPEGLIPYLSGVPAFMSLSEGGIGLAVGEGQAAQIRDALKTTTPDSAIFGYSINMAAYGRFMENMMSEAFADAEPGSEVPPMDFLSRMGDSYEESRVQIRLTPEGIDFVNTVTLKR